MSKRFLPVYFCDFCDRELGIGTPMTIYADNVDGSSSVYDVCETCLRARQDEYISGAGKGYRVASSGDTP